MFGFDGCVLRSWRTTNVVTRRGAQIFWLLFWAIQYSWMSVFPTLIAKALCRAWLGRWPRHPPACSRCCWLCGSVSFSAPTNTSLASSTLPLPPRPPQPRRFRGGTTYSAWCAASCLSSSWSPLCPPGAGALTTAGCSSFLVRVAAVVAAVVAAAAVVTAAVVAAAAATAETSTAATSTAALGRIWGGEWEMLGQVHSFCMQLPQTHHYPIRCTRLQARAPAWRCSSQRT